MFQNLLGFWKGKDFLHGILNEFSNMLQDGQDMFKSACGRITEERPGKEDLKEKLYALDKRINDIEKDIRKKVVEHLSIQPGADLPFCLILMSVVKDAERLGDYAKNLLEVSKFKKESWDKKLYFELFGNLSQRISEMFDKTKKAFVESDRNIAEDMWSVERELAKKLDKTIEHLASSDIDTNQAVCFTLIARYFKRISAHLTNIATSVVLPISELDFYDERHRNPESK